MTIWMKHSRRYKRHGPLVDMLGVGVEQLRHDDDGEEGRHQQHWNIDSEGTFAFLTAWYRWARTRRGTVSRWRARWASPPSSSCAPPRPGPGRPAGSSSGSCCSCQGRRVMISTQYLLTIYQQNIYRPSHDISPPHEVLVVFHSMECPRKRRQLVHALRRLVDIY